MLNILLFAFSGGIIGFLVTCLILAIVIYVVKLILDMIGLPQPVKTIVYLILGLIALFYLLSKLGVNLGI